ncbi:MAG TPA: signal peptidase I [Candidatus Dormibacteraeota bacterium]|nr:signal peptidase I [Candidatus Dormibacteraeota bacterium]
MGLSRAVLGDLLEILVVAVGLYLIASVTIEAVHVVGSSMNPSLQNNDLVIASRIDYRLHSPERGDIVIVRDPYDPSQNFIKRVIGLPGDQVLIRAGHVYLNGLRLKEPYISADWRTTTNWPALPDQPDGEVVPPGNYFVLGDNRDHSSDSRLFGYIAQSQLEGRAIVRFWPVSGIELLDVKPTLAKEPLSSRIGG